MQRIPLTFCWNWKRIVYEYFDFMTELYHRLQKGICEIEKFVIKCVIV